jgi:hypothetical protein
MNAALNEELETGLWEWERKRGMRKTSFSIAPA